MSVARVYGRRASILTGVLVVLGLACGENGTNGWQLVAGVPATGEDAQRFAHVNVQGYGARGDGLSDDYSAIAAAMSRVAPGGTVEFPPGTYRVGAVLRVTKPLRLVLRAATVQASAPLVVSSSDVRVEGEGPGTVWRFSGGDAKRSMNRAVRILGGYTELRRVVGVISPGAISFTVLDAAEAGHVAAGDWVVVGEWVGDWHRLEWQQVEAVRGNAIGVRGGFSRELGRQYPAYWRHVTNLVQNVTVRNMSIVTTGTSEDSIGIDAQVGRDLVLEDIVFDVARGLAFQVLAQVRPVVRRNRINRQVGRRSSVASTIEGYVGQNQFFLGGQAPLNGALSVETGTWKTVFAGNVIVAGGGGAGLIYNSYADDNLYVENAVLGGESIGLFIHGGTGNKSVRNLYEGLKEGIRIQRHAGVSPVREVDNNWSIEDRFRGTVTGVYVANGATRSAVLCPVGDSRVGVILRDAGKATWTRSGCGEGGAE